jgi:tetratricopeptide (TPR) repeat protein
MTFRLGVLFLFFAVVCTSLVAQTYVPTKSAWSKYQDAQKALGHRDVMRAMKLYGEAAAADPNWAVPHIETAGLYSLTKKYSSAAEEWQKARELDDKHKQLTPQQRHEVLDGLGVSLALGGNIDRSMAVYREAIKEDPEYPLYYYNLACGYAEKGDLDGALPQLQKAWELRDNLPSGQRFPDVHKDSSFERYVGNPKFEDAVRNMVD